MRIVHLNAYDGNGGAGRAMMRLHHALKHAGVQSEVLCLYQFRSHSDVTPVYRTWLGKLRSIVFIFGERYLVKLLRGKRGVPFSLQRLGVNVHQHPLVRQADIIHLHWVNHGMLAPRQLKKLFASGKPFVWTLHDSNPITGGCHVRYDCHHYENSCGNCPALNSESETDWSHRTWKAKADAYKNTPVTWVVPSRWMGESARRASLTRGDAVEVIGNALDTTLFYPRNGRKSRAALGIPQHAYVLLAGHMPSSTDRHKGRKELKEAIRHFREIPGVDHSRIMLVFFGDAGGSRSAGDGGNRRSTGNAGGHSGEGVEHWPYPCHFAGTIDREELLAEYYSLANIFLFPSLQESMGYTALESLACGTPVVAFDTSGVTDVVLHKQNGYLAGLGDSIGFAQGIKWIYDHQNREELGTNGVAHAAEHFATAVVAEKHIRLYEKLLRT